MKKHEVINDIFAKYALAYWAWNDCKVDAFVEYAISKNSALSEKPVILWGISF